VVAAPRKTKSSAKSAESQVKAYLAAVPPKPRSILKRLRRQVHTAAPTSVDGFTYRMPCLRIDDRPLIWYAAFKNHVSLFPITPPVMRPVEKELRGYETSKGTLRIPFDKPLSAALVKKLVKARLRVMNGR